MGRGAYGTVEFWDEWYAEDDHADYDWLLAWDDFGEAIESLIGDHDKRVLVVGCGNSPFSSELFARGYRNVVNVDNCESIIAVQRLRYPMLRWLVGDVRSLPFNDGSFDLVLDKGCLDNLYCYVDTTAAVAAFIRETRRLLRAESGRFVVVSCHDEATTRDSLSLANWRFSILRVPNPRWPRIRVETYELALCETGASDHDLAAVLGAAVARTRLCRRDDTLAAAAATTGRCGTGSLPSRLAHLERRSSGRRHSDLIGDE
ncbi:hypothetical protein CTAYLR_009536 [Chrysophaeum taylorii]|uniref:Methyltransferase type 11 domain-containing protein n=1 Tax=Chrysophaeum taylorii TaxID=2483200 RepID=A0AAD7UI56_9STRA|nr:hypothetical protein CTAYLR_009536 [Chrysophaeum taylorii]